MAEELKPEAEKPVAKKSSNKSTATKSTTAKKTTAKSTTSKSTTTKKSSTAKTSASKNTTAKKTTTTKSTTAKKSTATKSTTTKKTTASTAKKPAAKKTAKPVETVTVETVTVEPVVEEKTEVVAEPAVEMVEVPAEPVVEISSAEIIEPAPAVEAVAVASSKPKSMTVKEFFKSNTFKCIITLLSILLVCGILLTIAYGFLEVTDDIRLSRAINKIYGYEVGTPENLADENGVIENSTLENATIMEAYFIPSESDYLIKSKGKGGFGGTVRCWVSIKIENGAITYVSKVVVEGSDGETFLNNIDFLDKFPETPYTGQQFGFVTSGASMSSAAINHAVNGAVEFVNGVLAGGNK